MLSLQSTKMVFMQNPALSPLPTTVFSISQITMKSKEVLTHLWCQGPTYTHCLEISRTELFE